MSESKRLPIPEFIAELPTVRAGRVYNANGNFVNLGNINASSIQPTLSHNIDLLRHDTDSQYGVIRICDLTVEEVEAVYEQNNEVAAYSCQSALVDRYQSRIGYGISAVNGSATLICSFFAAARGLTLLDMPACRPQITNAVTDARCSSLDYAEYRSDLKLEGGLSGLGMVVLAMATFMAFKFGAQKSTEADVNFVKAALSQGNAKLCEPALQSETYTPS